MERAVSQAGSGTPPGKLYVVGTPIGNLEDITLRALRVLGEVPIIAAEDTRAAQHLLQHHRVRAGKEPPRIVSFFTGNEAQRTAQVLERLHEGDSVALISEAGLPGISDPGERLVAAALSAGIPVEIVPGPSASLTALVGSGLGTSRFLFVGFPPRSEGERQQLFGGLRSEPGTLLFYESAERLHRTLVDLAAALGPQRRACVARELTKLYEEYVRAPLGELIERYAQARPRGEVTLAVAGAADPSASREDAAGLPAGGVDLEAEVRRRLKTGQGPREIAAALTLLTGQPRRKLYQLALTVRPDASVLDHAADQAAESLEE